MMYKLYTIQICYIMMYQLYILVQVCYILIQKYAGTNMLEPNLYYNAKFRIQDNLFPHSHNIVHVSIHEAYSTV